VTAPFGSQPALRFPAAEEIGMALLEGTEITIGGQLVVVHATITTTTTLVPPHYRVRRIPGTARTLFDDAAHLEVLSLGADWDTCHLLAEAASARFAFAYATAVELPDGTSVTIDHTASILPPFEIPWANPDVRAFQATYQVTVRGVPV
jgi:hypothetical protein